MAGRQRARTFPLPVCLPQVVPRFLARAELEIVRQTSHSADGETEGYGGGTCPVCLLTWWLSLPTHPLSRRQVSEAEGTPQPGQELPVTARHNAQNGPGTMLASSVLDPWGLVGSTVTKRFETYFPDCILQGLGLCPHHLTGIGNRVR